jgi:hypothetical protein
MFEKKIQDRRRNSEISGIKNNQIESAGYNKGIGGRKPGGIRESPGLMCVGIRYFKIHPWGRIFATGLGGRRCRDRITEYFHFLCIRWICDQATGLYGPGKATANF